MAFDGAGARSKALKLGWPTPMRLRVGIRLRLLRKKPHFDTGLKNLSHYARSVSTDIKTPLFYPLRQRTAPSPYYMDFTEVGVASANQAAIFQAPTDSGKYLQGK